ncbi:ribosome biogenesis GTP-binding protein YihA/YsxC [Acholeplasma laidlawii]|uniref:ribosome biogenesis GTP-binding protein YihA/YsxC n=1 Tax=Acholeplasma laidlawii TaxID=2148 RepID=UPI000A53A095|nr:ribosome biogenesis GTP-binding protein YihA/YsxC [Acholeplasma laidlawii]
MIKQAEFITSAVSITDLPKDDFDHFLILGRSNVGKSSLINAITNRKKLARVSQTPGKTITLNLYLLNQSLYLVDAPGYGYAKRSKTQTLTFMRMINEYIQLNGHLKKLFYWWILILDQLKMI